MFDNRIATLSKETQGKFYCASVLKDSRVRERESKKMADDSSASSLNYQISNSEIQESAATVEEDSNRKVEGLFNRQSQIGNRQ